MVQIRPATLADLPALVELENRLFTSDRIPIRQFRYILTKARAISVVIEEHGIVVGYLILLHRKNSSKLRIYSIGISPTTQRKGYARSLLLFAEQTAVRDQFRCVTLEVCEQNSPAITFYTTCGFYMYGSKPGYYENGCTALLLRKDILQESRTA